MASARPLYIGASGQTRLGENDVLNANAMEVFGTVPGGALNLFPTAGTYAVSFLDGTTGNITIGAGSTGTVAIAGAADAVNIGLTATTVDIGDSGTTVNVNGDLTVDGDEIVVGTTIFDDNVTFGDGAGPLGPCDVLFNSDSVVQFHTSSKIGTVAYPSMTFDTATTAFSMLTTNGGGTNGLTVNVTNGPLAFETTTAGSISFDPAADSNFSVTTTTTGTGGAIFLDADDNSHFTAKGADLTLSTSARGGSGGDVDISAAMAGAVGGRVHIAGQANSYFQTSAGTLDITGAGLTTVSSSAAGVNVTAALNNNVVVSTSGSGGATLQSGATGLATVSGGSSGIDITSASGGSIDVSTTSANITLTTTTGGKLDVGLAGALEIDSGATSYIKTTGATLTLETTGAYNLIAKTATGLVSMESGNANAVAQLKNTGGNTARLLVGSGDPAALNGNAGDLYLNIAAADGAPYYCSTTGTPGTWVQVGTASGNTLQQAYNNGQVIQVAASGSGDDPLTFRTNDTPASEQDVRILRGGASTDSYLTADASAGTVVLGAYGGSEDVNVDIAGMISTQYVYVDASVNADFALLNRPNQTSAWTMYLEAQKNTGVGGGNVTITAGVDATAVGQEGGNLTAQGNYVLVTNTGSSGTIEITGKGNSTYTTTTGTLQLTGSGTTTLSSTLGGIAITASTAAQNINLTTSTTGTINVGAAGTPGPVVVSSTTFDVNASGAYTGTGSSVAFDTTSNGNISLTPNGTGKIQLVAANASGYVQVRSGHATEAIELYALAASPNGSLSASSGSIASVDDGVNPGALWVNTSVTSGNTWSKTVTTSTGTVTLQNAYDASADPATIALAANKELYIQLDAGGTGDFAIANNALTAAFLFADSSANLVSLGNSPAIDVNINGKVSNNVTFKNTSSRSISYETGGTPGSDNFTVTNAGAGIMYLRSQAGGVTVDATGGNVRLATVSTGDITADPANNGNVTLTTTGSGITSLVSAAQVDLTCNAASGVIDINATGTGGSVTVDTKSFSIDGTTNSNITIQSDGVGAPYISIEAKATGGSGSGANIRLTAEEENSQGGQIEITGRAASYFKTINSGTLDVVGYGHTYIGSSNSDLTLYTDSTTGGDIILSSRGFFSINTDSDVINQTMHIVTHDADPNGSYAAAPRGSIALVDAATPTFAPWIKTADSPSTVWTRLALASEIPGAATLDSAYNNGQTIGVNTTPGDLVITLEDTGASFIVQDTTSSYNYINASKTGSGTVTLGDTTNVTTVMSGYVASNITFDSVGQTTPRVITENYHLTLQTTGGGNLTCTSSGAQGLTLNGTAGGVKLNGGGSPSIFESTSQNITIRTVTGGALQLQSVTTLDLSTTSNGNITIVPNGTGCTSINTASPTANYALTISGGSTGAISLIGGNRIITSNNAAMTLQTTTAGNITVQTTGATGNIEINSVGSANLQAGSGSDVSVQTSGGGTVAIRGNGTGPVNVYSASSGTVSVYTGASGSVSMHTTNAGDINIETWASSNVGGIIRLDSTRGSSGVGSDGAVQIEADYDSNFTTSAGTLTLTGAGVTTLSSSAAGVAVTAPAGQDVTITATSNAASDIILSAHGFTTLTVNEDGTRSNFASTNYISAATSIVGALRDLDAALAAVGDTVVSYTVREVAGVAAKDVVALGDNAGTAGLYQTDADTTTYRQKFVGVVKTGASAGSSADVYVAGDVAVNDINDSPAIGKYVYLDMVQNQLTCDPTQVTAGTLLRVGVCSNATSTTMRMLIQVGEAVTL